MCLRESDRVFSRNFLHLAEYFQINSLELFKQPKTNRDQDNDTVQSINHLQKNPVLKGTFCPVAPLSRRMCPGGMAPKRQ